MSKKIMDERGRLFGVINIIDVIVILLAVVLVCGVYGCMHLMLPQAQPLRMRV